MAELDRIVQRREATKEMKELWMNNVPKIIAVANEEGNPHLRALCDEAKAPISEGEYVSTFQSDPCMCIVSRSILATLMLAYLLPDTRTAAKSSRLIIFTSVWK